MLLRDAFLGFSRPDVDDAELEQIREALESGWITSGPKTHQFETEFAAAVGARHAVTVSSCTAAMHLSLEALGLRRGDEVITTPYTFAATAEVVRYFDAKPVLVDVHPDCLNIDPDLVEAAVSPRTKALIPVHLGGLPAEMDALLAIARRHGLAVVEDAAHAFPAEYKGHVIGSALGHNHIQHAICFSFYATKTLTTGEGGMIVTDDDAIAERCRMMALHGISKDAWKRYTAEGTWQYDIVAPGFKYNMTDIAAGMGLAQLAKAERMWARRRQIARQYNAAFQGLPALRLPHDRDDCRHAWHLYMLRVDPERLPGLKRAPAPAAEDLDGAVRAGFVQELKERRIGSSVHFIPLHLHPYYRETYGYRPEDFPVASREYRREVSLPIYSRMDDQDVQDVIDAVLDIVRQHGG
jgi:dTDP-4-amino-4,6-dideoxygalactose transaminase